MNSVENPALPERISKAGSTPRRLPLLLRRAWYGLNQAFRRRIAHLGITPDQFTVMRTLEENADITQQELTRRMSSDPNTVAGLVKRMEAAGWLSRRPHEADKRAQRLRLQAEGREKFALAQRYAVELQEEVLRGVPALERGQFLHQLGQVADACRQAAISELDALNGQTG